MPGKSGPIVNPPSSANEWGLTPGEMEILRWVVDGETNQQIAERRGIAPQTARNYVGRIADILLDEHRWKRERLVAFAQEHIFKES